jgi:hypothetical protein
MLRSLPWAIPLFGCVSLAAAAEPAGSAGEKPAQPPLSQNKNAVRSDDLPAGLMEPLGQRTIRTVGGSDANVTRDADALPFCHGIFADMGRYSGRNGIANLTYTLPSGLPVFRAVTSCRYGKEGFLREVREQVGSQRPAFVNGFVHCWTFTMDDLARIHEQRDPDMIFVTPSQLAQLYREAQTKGWAKQPACGEAVHSSV